MGIYTRYKRDPDGLRRLVELLESSSSSRRKRMTEVGMQEDPEFTAAALELILTFDDLLKLNDAELAEILHSSSPRAVALASRAVGPGDLARYLSCCPRSVAAEIKDLVDPNPFEINGARSKLIEAARTLERKGILRCKVIPYGEWRRPIATRKAG